MATVAASTEKLAEIKADEAQPAPTTAAPAAEGTSTSTAAPAAADAAGDVAMTDEEEKDRALRAVRQSTSLVIPSPVLEWFHDDLRLRGAFSF